LFQGKIFNWDVILNATHGVSEKVTQVRRIFPGRYEESGIVEAGDIAGISGLGSVQI
jgi:ribosomal protection tetracycline resistance protein